MKYIITIEYMLHQEYVMKNETEVGELYDEYKTDYMYIVRQLDGDTDEEVGEFKTYKEAKEFIEEKENGSKTE